jgi:hypothetical protein
MSTSKKTHYSSVFYTVCGKDGYDLSTALRLWKAKYNEFKDFEKDVILHESLKDFSDFVEEMWDSIKPITVKDALALQNAEDRRIYFDCIGVNRLFKELNPTIRDKQTIKKKRTRWDDKNDPYTYEFEDVYELYEIPGDKLFPKDRWGRASNPVFAVRCWCTTTNREYWLYVHPEAATGKRWFNPEVREAVSYDAIRAIAWTVRVDVSEPERIYRQGDIIVAKLSKKSKTVPAYHLDKQQYLQLMYSET